MDKVLVIEDDAIIGDMLLMYLKEEGFDVTRKAAGKEGLYALNAYKPDIVLLDLMLPDIDGLELCRLFRQNSNIPILVLSMKIKITERVNALAAGADDYMSKPFSMHELIARVQALLRRSRNFESSSLAHPVILTEEFSAESSRPGSIVDLDSDTRTMRVHNEMVETTYSEFEIMRCFLEHPNKVYSREELINAIRGFDSFVTDRAIDVHIANLRKKIEENPKEPKRIRTVWGVGYKYVP
jgi:DNA-binding response OmpR family regulator